MALKKGQTYELDITQVAFGGKGLCRVNGMAVFVDQTVPGDRVTARIVKKKKNYAEARVLELIKPSTHRVKAPCPYSGICGGCKWQFLAYQTQLEYKQQHVCDALVHIGGLKDIPVRETLPSALVFGYRNKMEFSFTRCRWLMPHELGRDDVDKGMALGLHVPGTFNKVLDIQTCLLQPELGNELLEKARRYVRTTGRPVYDLRSHEGFWRFVVLRHSAAFDQWMVNIVTASEDRALLAPLADIILREHPQVASVVNNITARKAAVAKGEREILLAGRPTILDCVGPHEFELSANSFFQTNTRGAMKLYDTVRQYAGLGGREKVLDLYCGAGTIAVYLADAAAEVVGMEMVESAVRDARRNCRRNGIDNCRFVQGDVRFALPQLDFKPDVIIIDPPRAGMHEDVVRQVLEMAPRRIVYVSCNPATLARDLAMMKETYQVVEVQPVDMFPHTFHIESVARLVKMNSG